MPGDEVSCSVGRLRSPADVECSHVRTRGGSIGWSPAGLREMLQTEREVLEAVVQGSLPRGASVPRTVETQANRGERA